MPVEIIETKFGYYIPMDGPWDSEEDEAAFAAAERKYEEAQKNNDYVALIKSYHEYSHGYWVENRVYNVNYPDLLLKQYKKIPV